ncbi:MAG: 50S ribosomal protein L13 [Salibacteraceae bacterium]
MDSLSYKTISANAATADKKWVVVDVDGMVLGRAASRIAFALRGKHKTNYTPHVDCGDNVVVLNAEKVQLTGTKWDNKEYIRHTGYPGGQRVRTAKELLEHRPIAVVENAVRGMLPKNRLGRELFRNLYVYTGNEHPHQGQNPTAINLNDIK